MAQAQRLLGAYGGRPEKLSCQVSGAAEKNCWQHANKPLLFALLLWLAIDVAFIFI